MTIEIRHILFDAAELAYAVREYHRRMGTDLPGGTPLDCAVADAGIPDGVTVTARWLRPDGKVEGLDLGGRDLTQALILACLSRQIPLPAKHAKTTELFAGRVGLVITNAAERGVALKLSLATHEPPGDAPGEPGA